MSVKVRKLENVISGAEMEVWYMEMTRKIRTYLHDLITEKCVI